MTRRPRWLQALLAGLVLGVLGAPPATAAPAEHVVIPIVNVLEPIDFEDPCTGLALHGIATENGEAHIVDLGDRGHHVRIETLGVVDLYDEQDEFVGTWTYRLRFGDQYPPDGQGAVHMSAVGRLTYADGDVAIVRVLFEHEVFGKGDVSKREFANASCGRRG